ncbi:MAG: hypothetical protein LUO89_07055, partial [Methanothrix sp.]|nr:hypothetical protein [Methanothrix sp.]
QILCIKMIALLISKLFLCRFIESMEPSMGLSGRSPAGSGAGGRACPSLNFGPHRMHQICCGRLNSRTHIKDDEATYIFILNFWLFAV